MAASPSSTRPRAVPFPPTCRASRAAVRAWWFNPRTGAATDLGTFSATGTRTFTPPTSGTDHDWLLVVDDATRGFGAPGGGSSNVPSAARPTISPAGGTHGGPVAVSIATATSSASIRYTLNGTTPTASTGTAYAGPFTVTSSATVNAIAHASGMTASPVASASFIVSSTTFSPVSISFQPATAPAQNGWLVDAGRTFGDRGAGRTYGWNSDISGTTRDRNAGDSPDQVHDTLIHLQKGGDAVWEMAVPNGSYQVRIISGDADYFDSV